MSTVFNVELTLADRAELFRLARNVERSWDLCLRDIYDTALHEDILDNNGDAVFKTTVHLARGGRYQDVAELADAVSALELDLAEAGLLDDPPANSKAKALVDLVLKIRAVFSDARQPDDITGARRLSLVTWENSLAMGED
ncbi:MAG: hypothetical protein LBG60_09910 [Bifidobacteriaceae bacterium]|jgi:hypothetical protein|nr:hypothetical protein [Bifidobacteriaceae bacterium]